MVLQIQTLNLQAYDLIKEKILSKEIQPGTRLVDSQLAEDFGISRTPARDAIRKLAEEGLVITKPGKKGYFVYQPSARDIDEIYEFRQILELAAAEKLISEVLPADPSALDALRSCCQAPASDTVRFSKCDDAFHLTMVELCGNSRMTETYIQLATYLHAFRSKTSLEVSRNEKAAIHHQLILEGLQAGDLLQTQAHIRSHILLSREDTIADHISTQ